MESASPPRKEGEPPIFRQSGCGGLAFVCPACGVVLASGLLLCTQCEAIFYFALGHGKAISPIAGRMYSLSVAESRYAAGTSAAPARPTVAEAPAARVEQGGAPVAAVS